MTGMGIPQPVFPIDIHFVIEYFSASEINFAMTNGSVFAVMIDQQVIEFRFREIFKFVEVKVFF